tara:strand:- start:9768 stop:10547 length:780 start_codon:yes stop_codon:yes gene_type:complete
MYCKNCGKKGHSFGQCKLPILSYGILAYKRGGENKLLMIQRRDSLCYIEFLRGKYKFEDKTYIKVLLSNFTKDEIKSVKEKEFDELWFSLWMTMELKNSRVRNEYGNSKRNFQKLKASHQLDSLLNEIEIIYHSPEWEFPKGRRNNQEYNRDCAIREFGEETGINKDYTLLANVKPLVEEYVGTNGVRYKHIYYIAEYIGDTMTHQIDPKKIEQCGEINDIQWFTENECLQHLRNNKPSKKQIIQKVFQFLRGHENINK